MGRIKKKGRVKKTAPAPFNNPFIENKKKIHRAVSAGEEAPNKPPQPPPRIPKNQFRDEDLFQEAMTGVTPLEKADAPLLRRPSPPPTAPQTTEEVEVLAALADLVHGTGSFEVADTTEYIEGIARGLDTRLLKKLRRGDFSVQAHLDLHGMVCKEAQPAVIRFLRDSRANLKRCVLIICGRGHHSKDKTPVLKTQLARWLTRGGMRKNILAFCSARPHDGGAGAVYVLLRK